MDPARLKRDSGSDLALWGGGIPPQTILPHGTPA
jgi:hypothetical protein